MDGDEEIERAAAAIAEGYRDIGLEAFAGVFLLPYHDNDEDPAQLAPVPYGIPAPHLGSGLDTSLMRELDAPDVEAHPRMLAAGAALLARVAADDAYDLVDAYWLALARRIGGLVGVPVLVHDHEMPIAEQLARQVEVSPEDPLAGLDVVVSERIDPYRVAAVWRHPEGHLLGAARVGAFAWEVLWPVRLGEDPEVMAGCLPDDAVAAFVRDARGEWHAARVAGGAWLCVLPQRARQHEPEVEFRDAGGAVVPLPSDGWPTA